MAAMFEILAKAFVSVLGAYGSLGLLFAIPFVSLGVQRLDSEARGTKLAFRLLILPGVAAFWPMFFLRWARHTCEPPLERNPHRRTGQS